MGTRSLLGIRERVPTSARTNDLCKCSICYPCFLSSFPPPPASPRRRRFHRGRNGREIQSGSECERRRERCEEETRLREKRGPKRRRRRRSSIPEPGLDPRPSPPKSSTAARPQFRFVFSAPLCSFLVFSSLRVSLFFFIYLPSLFRPFLPDHGDNRPTLCLLLLLRLLLLRPPMFLRRVLTGENCGKNVVDLRDPLRG